jgi:ribbon-helix-helix CopG family protein
MKRTTIFMDEALEKDLQALARRRGTPVASVVREALAAYVAGAARAPALSFTGVGASGRRDIAVRHEDLLWKEPHADQARPPASRRKARAKRR